MKSNKPNDAAEAPQIDASQAADLAALEATAATLDSGAPGAPEPEPEPAAPPVDLAAELSGLVSAVVGMLAPAYPTVAALYTPATIETAAGAVARVCQKHGWLQGGVMGEYSEEITAAAILLPLAIGTVAAVKADNAARANAGKKPAATPAETTAPKGGGFDSALGKTPEQIAAEAAAVPT